MKNLYYQRDIEERVTLAARQFPSLLVTGARQAGKSTLLRHLFPQYRYLSLDDPSLRALANNDPALFLSTNPPPVVIDEIQYAPRLLPYVKMQIDGRRHLPGQFLLTGSQIFQLMQGVSETLAGRIAIFNLYPFSWRELRHVPGRDNAENDLAMAGQTVGGFYPEQFVIPGLDLDSWYSSYIATYLERDVRNIRKIDDLGLFQKFITLLAARAGGILNVAEVAKECGITQPTARAWITVLESTYIVYQLKPLHANITKRVVKSPKLYFVDTGLLCYLLGIDSAERFFKAAERGRVFENMVVVEALKRTSALPGKTDLFFYRTGNGVEVDLIIDRGGERRAYEIKLSKTVSPSEAGGLLKSRPDIGFATGQVLCLREDPLPFAEDISACHWSKMDLGVGKGKK